MGVYDAIDLCIGKHRWPKTHAAGRTCATCGKTLSRYNPDATCYNHAPEPELEYCGYRFKVCNDCGKLMMCKSKAQWKVPGLCAECRSARAGS